MQYQYGTAGVSTTWLAHQKFPCPRRVALPRTHCRGKYSICFWRRCNSERAPKSGCGASLCEDIVLEDMGKDRSFIACVKLLAFLKLTGAFVKLHCLCEFFSFSEAHKSVYDAHKSFSAKALLTQARAFVSRSSLFLQENRPFFKARSSHKGVWLVRELFLHARLESNIWFHHRRFLRVQPFPQTKNRSQKHDIWCQALKYGTSQCAVVLESKICCKIWYFPVRFGAL